MNGSCCKAVVPEWIQNNLPGGDAQPHPPPDHEAGDVEEEHHGHHGGERAEPGHRGHQQHHVPGRRHLLRRSETRASNECSRRFNKHVK